MNASLSSSLMADLVIQDVFLSDGVSESDYQKYRGKCKEMSEAAVAEDPTLRLVRGHYYCPIWGEQPHWWTVRPDGTVVDPTAAQFPSKGTGEYVEFDGNITCELCQKVVREEDAYIVEHHAYCSSVCYGRDVFG